MMQVKHVAIAGTGVEGVLTLRELTNDRNADINELVKVGETLELLVLRQVVGKDTDTVTYLVSKKRLEARKAWDKLIGREGEVVTVKVPVLLRVVFLLSLKVFVDLSQLQ